MLVGMEVADTLSQHELAELTRFYAEEIERGAHDVAFDPDQRWHLRIYRDRRVDIWVISWLPTQGTQLHDHGGSSGAFTVVSGDLTEIVPSGFGNRLTVRSTTRAAGQTARFGTHYVHDVYNAGDTPAVSVHAYSPPLTSMNFYDISDGDLVHVARQVTDDPETELKIAS